MKPLGQFMLAEILPYMMSVLEAKVFKAETMARNIRLQMSPYSIAVAPLSSRMN